MLRHPLSPQPSASPSPLWRTGRFSKAYGLGVAAAFGGLSKQQQFKDLKAGCEVCGTLSVSLQAIKHLHSI